MTRSIDTGLLPMEDSQIREARARHVIDPVAVNIEAAAATAWVRDFFGEMTPSLASGVYSNYLAGDESDARVRAAYGRSWDRLVVLKRKFDPDNFFRLNQNVNPAG